MTDLDATAETPIKLAALDELAPDATRRGPRYNSPYQDEPGVIEQFRPGECQARFEAEWDDESGNWIFGKRVDDA